MPADCPAADQTQQLCLVCIRLFLADSQLTPTYLGYGEPKAIQLRCEPRE
jgi:hypothetical protein